MHRPLVVLFALSASSPARASCETDGAAAPCEYLPHSEANYSGCGGAACIDDGTVPDASTPVDDILYRVTIPRSGFYETTATCNDTSPAVMYVRKALTAADEDKWVVVFEGGGTSYAPLSSLDQGMWDRWTGDDGKLLSWIRKTSTDWHDAAGSPGQDQIVDMVDELVIGGVLDSTSSEFADWNWVFLNYCSSDSWQGRVTGLDLPGAGTWSDGVHTYVGYKADFNGRYIVEAAFSLLRRNFSWGTDADPTYAMPDIDDASVVLVAGESAGAHGVAHNLDAIEYGLASYNSGVTVLGSIGAILRPPIVAGSSWSVDNDSDGVDDIQEGIEARWAQVLQVDPMIDASCDTTYSGDWHCGTLYYLEQELSTEHFIKQDYRDEKTSTGYSGNGYRDGLDFVFAEYRAASPRVPYFGPNCAHHESLTSNPHFSHALDRADVATGAVAETATYNSSLADFVDGLVPRANAGYSYTDTLGTTWRWQPDCP